MRDKLLTVKGHAESSYHPITDPQAISLMMKDRVRLILGHYFNGNTVSGVALSTGLDLRVVHRDTLALLNIGLLVVEREEPRSGRPVRHYRTSHEAYFIAEHDFPLEVVHAREQQEQRQEHLFRTACQREFDRALHAEGRTWGLCLYRLDAAPGFHQHSGDQFSEQVSELERWQGPAALMMQGRPLYHLTPAKAREVQLKFITLMRECQKLERQSGDQGQPFLLQVGLAPLTEDEAQGLSRPRV